MNQYPYWQKQLPAQPLFPEVEWNKPERRDQAGRLGIVGGSSLGFISVAESWRTADQTGAGENAHFCQMRCVKTSRRP